MRTFVFLFLLAVRAPAAGPAAFHVDYTTYLGGSLDDQPAGIAVDTAGNAYIVGTTSSPDFPFTSYDFFVPYQRSARSPPAWRSIPPAMSMRREPPARAS